MIVKCVVRNFKYKQLTFNNLLSGYLVEKLFVNLIFIIFGLYEKFDETYIEL
jgi:hypothetical protein